MKKIAIQGHVTRGKDIIKILENLGGKNMFNCEGYNVALFYYINSSGFITCNFSKGMPEGYEYYTLEDYEQQLLNTMETKRNIQIDLTTAKEWYKQGGDLKKVALQAFSEKELQSLPKSWEEYCKINPYIETGTNAYFRSAGTFYVTCANLRREEYPGIISSKERAEQFLTLNKLLQIRDYYNQGWEPNWDEEMENKYVIMGERDKLVTYVFSYTMCLFSFKTRELRDEFLTNFKKDLEFIKEFL